MFSMQTTKVPVVGSQAFIKLPGQNSFSLALVVAVPAGRNHDFTKVPVKLVVFSAEDETVSYIETTYGVEENQWFFIGDFGIR